MKKYILIFLTAIAIVGTSCQKEEKLIIGTWEASSVSGTITDEDGEEIFSGTFPVSLIGVTINLEFKKNNSCSYFIKFLTETQSGIGIYSIKDDTLYLDGEAVNIQKLNRKELILDMEFEENKTTVTFKKI